MTTPRETIDQAIKSNIIAFSDGLDISDLDILLRHAVQLVDTLDGVTNAEKRELALHYMSELLDVVWDKATPKLLEAIKAVDIPWVPEGIEASVIDPLIAQYAPDLLRALAKLALPTLVDLVIDASKGGVQVNTELWAKASTAIALVEKHGEVIERALGMHDEVHGEAGVISDVAKALRGLM